MDLFYRGSTIIPPGELSTSLFPQQVTLHMLRAPRMTRHAYFCNLRTTMRGQLWPMEWRSEMKGPLLVCENDARYISVAAGDVFRPNPSVSYVVVSIEGNP